MTELRKIFASPMLMSLLEAGLKELERQRICVREDDGTVYADPKHLANSYARKAYRRWQEFKNKERLYAIYRTEIGGGLEIGVFFLVAKMEFFVGLRTEIEKMVPAESRGQIVIPPQITDEEWRSYIWRN